MDWRPNSRSAYRALLFAYPAEFREEYGAEMDLLLSERAAGEPRLRIWLTLIGDVIRNAPREHLHVLARDLRHSLRLFAKAPAFTATTLAALALGIGAAVTIFTLINAVLIRALPIGDAARLVFMWSPLPRYRALPPEMGPSFADVAAWRTSSRSFESITAFQQRMLTWSSGGESARLGGALVFGNFFETLQARPLLGRAIDANDDRPGEQRVAVISYGLWASQFNRDPGAIGKTALLGGRAFQVVGVMPPEFAFPQQNDFPHQPVNAKRTDIWIPIALSPQQQSNRMITATAAIGRLRPGVPLARAQAEMSAIAAGLDPLNVAEMRGIQSLLAPFIETAVGPVRTLMRLLSGAVMLVLLIACGNVASLLLARAATREHEMGVRTAMGAPRSRLVRQVLTESVFLSVAGGVLGALISAAALQTMARINPGDIPRFDEISMDWRVLLFALAISLFTGIVFGALPAITSSRANVADLLREGGARGIAGGSSHARFTLVAADVALAVVLVGGAVLLIRSYLYVQGQEKGFAPSTLTMQLAVDVQFRVPPQKIAGDWKNTLERIAALPGVVAAGAVNNLPLSHRESTAVFQVEGYQNRPNQTADWRRVAGDYFTAMQIPLIAGRFLTAADIAAQPPPIVVSESFAKIYFAGRSAVGGRVKHGPWSTVVGVVADVRHSNLESPPTPTLYEPSWELNSLAIRTVLPPEPALSAVRAAIRDSGAAFVPAEIETMRQRIGEASAHRRFQTVLLGAFASIALLLALVGLYGLLAYAVRQRTAEIGVRMALGASREKVVALILRQGLGVTGIGLIIGLLAAAGVARWSASLLYGIRALDPITFIAVPILVMAAASIASILPAWKASRVDPVTSLRHQ
jgi:putative ABC transport system permease protein